METPIKPGSKHFMAACAIFAGVTLGGACAHDDPSEADRTSELVLDATTQDFLDGLVGAPPIYTLTPAQARQVLLDVQSDPGALPPVEFEDRILPVGPTGQTRIRVIRPPGAEGVGPALVYFHGAGWVMGDAFTHDRLVRELAIGADATVIFVDYERSPEHRYPVAIEQDYAVTQYVTEHPDQFAIDPTRVAIAGDSVGGNMVAAVSLMAMERGGPSFVAQLLFYPVTDASMSSASYREFAEGPWLTQPAMEWFWDAYLPDVEARQHPHASPLRATHEQLRGLPPALVITAQYDVLRDEGEAYARRLADAGVPVTVSRYDGTIHDFVMLNVLSQTPAARGAMDEAQEFLHDALHGT